MDIDDKIIGDISGYLLAEPAKVKRGTQVHEAMQVLLDNPYSRKIYIIDDNQKLLGSISYLHIIRVSTARYKIRKAGFWPFIRYLKDMFLDDVSDLMKNANPVRDDKTLKDALEIMLENDETDLPVVDKDGRLLGELRGMEIMRLSLEAVKQGDERSLEHFKKIRNEKGIESPKRDPVTLKLKTE
ncbi:MAG: CBS domain-containing protein [Candidatus Thermoplasmatota archaeon]|nr:CBS domain-containing protein [Euryarchaeota archaeon]MBU4031885.1 CBS domain-containing protein [Candidatus Thermoplasmatota archaeon]MBU4071060.1 CBS domain-containing protein [Candidatus Thermoplasmatota archaeon]MBU4143815.1 CBS domain-containing protein [Candidatus Thermoplasmatota archaeon]MBU4591600.1 CBS domain-containing protein [Candidatus Thermoplasmatota archaeon]